MKKIRVSSYQIIRNSEREDGMKTYVRNKVYSDGDMGPFTEITMSDEIFDVLVRPEDMYKIRVYNVDFRNYYDTFVIYRKPMPRIKEACKTQIVWLMTLNSALDSSQFDTARDDLVSIAALCNLIPLVYKSRGCFFLEVISSN